MKNRNFLAAPATLLFASPALAQSPPPPLPAPVVLVCPAKGALSRRVDLSTGVADWRVSGPGVSPDTRAGRLRADATPPAWNGGIEGASWVQASPDEVADGSQNGQFVFETAFELKPSWQPVRLMVKGRAVADERSYVELVEAGPGEPSQGEGLADPPVPGQPLPQDVLDFGWVAGETSGTKDARPGRYVLRVLVQNSAAATEVGLMASVAVSQTCLNWPSVTPKAKKRKK